MKEYIKNFIWFINTSSSFLDKSKLWVITHGTFKAHKHALYMCKYNKLTAEQKENLYLAENRVMEF